MGLAYGNLQIMNPKRTDLQPISVGALADTGSVYLIIPEHVRVQLELEERNTKRGDRPLVKTNHHIII